jgi:hypothetical protein
MDKCPVRNRYGLSRAVCNTCREPLRALDSAAREEYTPPRENGSIVRDHEIGNRLVKVS